MGIITLFRFTMQSKTFYGKPKPASRFIRPIPQDSDDSELSGDGGDSSDDELYQPPALPDSSSDEDSNQLDNDSDDEGDTNETVSAPSKQTRASKGKQKKFM